MKTAGSTGGLTSGTKLAIGLLLGGTILGLLALKYRQYETPATQPATAPTTRST